MENLYPPFLDDKQRDVIRQMCEAEKIVRITHTMPSGPYILDEKWMFHTLTSHVFSILKHPDGSIHLWRPC